jgi:hypothetical protein
MDIFRALENKVLKRIFVLERQEVKKRGENCIMRSFINYTLPRILLGYSK